LSSERSATSFFNLTFSRSSSLSLRTCEVRIPPYSLRQPKVLRFGQGGSRSDRSRPGTCRLAPRFGPG
jgi:hypothetical protein